MAKIKILALHSKNLGAGVALEYAYRPNMR